jgi:beta-glucosidase
MTSYNRLNQVSTSEDERLLKGILREEWGYEGLVMSDW